jgi:HNH endonuclease
MARIRTIKPDFWESESIGRLSHGARLLFLACLNLADDEGILRWNPAFLSSNAFIYDELDTEQVSEWMHELVNESLMFPYTAGSMNQKLAWIINFRNHQVINRPQPSKLPHPSIQNPKFRAVLFERDKHICHLCGEQTNPSDPANISGSKLPSIDHIEPVSKGGNGYPSNLKTAHLSCNKKRNNNDLPYSVDDSVNDSVNDSLLERKGKEEEIEEERKGKESFAAKAAKTKKFSPPTIEEVAALVFEKKYSVNPESFVAYYTANGWMVGRNKMKDWQAAVVSWNSKQFGNSQNKQNRFRPNVGKNEFGEYMPSDEAFEEMKTIEGEVVR